MPVTYALANFVTGDLIADLPIASGCSFGQVLGKPDTLSVKLDARDDDVKALDLASIATPKKAVLFAESTTGHGTCLAVGIVGTADLADDDATFTISATGLRYYFSQRIIGPPEAKTANLTNADGSANTDLDIVFEGYDLGTIGKGLIELALSWPGATGIPFVLPPDVAGTDTRSYAFLDLKFVGDELDALTGVVDGPDFEFGARRRSDQVGIEYPLRIGNPYVGTYIGSWPKGGPVSPVISFPYTDDGESIATASWASAGRTDSTVLAARALNDDMLDSGYAPFDTVDTSHTDVSEQDTLDDYAAENAYQGRFVDRSFTLKVRGDTRVIDSEGTVDPDAPPLGPMLGDYQTGDYVAVDIADHPTLPDETVQLRILSITGDETGDVVSLDVMVVRESLS